MVCLSSCGDDFNQHFKIVLKKITALIKLKFKFLQCCSQKKVAASKEDLQNRNKTKKQCRKISSVHKRSVYLAFL